MVRQNNNGNLNRVLRLLYFLLPIFMVLFGAHFAYYGIYQRNKISHTFEDIIALNNNIKSAFSNSYKMFNTDVVVLQNLLPFNIEAQKTDNGYIIPNRFGGQIQFYEAFNTLKEKLLYFSLYNNPKKYQEVYPGTTAYIMFFTGLSRRECRILARTQWKSFLPNFAGIEVSYLDAANRYNGIFKLKTQLLSEPDNYYFESKDQGVISAVPLTRRDAKNSCTCRGRTCTIALKFN